MLRSYIPASIKYNWVFGVVLIVIFTITRFEIVLSANANKDYGNTSILFIFMALLPFLLLNKEGRKHIGIKKVENYWWLLIALIIGIVACSFFYFLFTSIYINSIENSFVYISTSYNLPELNEDNRFTFFCIYSITSMIFSPLGEELFYRGLIHGCFTEKLNENGASRIDSLAFAIAHLANFGIIYSLGKWEFLLLPAVIWTCCMYVLCRLFFICKQRSGSILGAILCHSGFNLAMIYWIFYHIL